MSICQQIVRKLWFWKLGQLRSSGSWSWRSVIVCLIIERGDSLLSKWCNGREFWVWLWMMRYAAWSNDGPESNGDAGNSAAHATSFIAATAAATQPAIQSCQADASVPKIPTCSGVNDGSLASGSSCPRWSCALFALVRVFVTFHCCFMHGLLSGLALLRRKCAIGFASLRDCLGGPCFGDSSSCFQTRRSQCEAI